MKKIVVASLLLRKTMKCTRIVSRALNNYKLRFLSLLLMSLSNLLG